MRAADLAHLEGLYAGTDDPWNFRTAPYEAERLDAVARALPRPRYAAALELGCGNGELARRVAPRCDTYTGLDAVPTALAVARRAVPKGRFAQGFLPCALPPAPSQAGYDLVLLSEVLYFLDADGVAEIAARIDRGHPDADVVTVTWRGPTGHALDGEGALAAFMRATTRSWRTARLTEGYRIVVFSPLCRAAR
ncbi:SAM-dependent methyltransferase [Palleronia rufa]|uniref:SAM-dependent methyltransferase n=1 Tax=Palleronia rufa TaxID=1530186 RepID=UPI0009DEECDC|nr:SAM-dependent methyltransferase [Palleronia rufa]